KRRAFESPSQRPVPDSTIRPPVVGRCRPRSGQPPRFVREALEDSGSILAVAPNTNLDIHWTPASRSELLTLASNQSQSWPPETRPESGDRPSHRTHDQYLAK